MIFTELKNIWKFIKTIALIVGVFLTFIAVVEAIRIYNILNEFHVYAGYALLVILGCSFLWILFGITKIMLKKTSVIYKPFNANESENLKEYNKRYCEYLITIMKHLMKNSEIENNDANKLNSEINQLKKKLNYMSSEELKNISEIVETGTLEPILLKLDEKADKVIRYSVRDVMLGVTLSPYHSMDLLIALYRNFAMVYKITLIYNSRPRVIEVLYILRSILKVVATLNYLNIASKLVENIGKRIPGIGPFIDDIMQGFGSGYMTSIAGNVAKIRCRSFKNWSYDQTNKRILSNSKYFVKIIKTMLLDDVCTRFLAPPLLKTLKLFWAAKEARNTIQGRKYAFTDTETEAYKDCMRHLIYQDIQNEKNSSRQQVKNEYLNQLINIDTTEGAQVDLINWQDKNNILKGINNIEKQTRAALFLNELYFGVLQLREKSKQDKNLKFDTKVMDDSIREYAKIMGVEARLIDNIKKTSDELIGRGLWQKIIPVAVVGTFMGVTGGLAAPAIGILIGQSVGLAGAAAVSYGLAFLGGGSLAAGGFGMAGGTALITALGAGSGIVGGGWLNKLATMGGKFIEYDVIKTQVLLKVILLDKYNDVEKAKDIMNEQQNNIEEFKKQLNKITNVNSKDKKNIEKTIGMLEKAVKWEEKQINKYNSPPSQMLNPNL